jgi:hypothetical protein
MSKPTREFFERIKDGKEALQETIKENLSLSKILGDLWKEGKEQLAHGAHELASALFRGDAFVMYPRTNHDKGAEHSQSQEPQQQVQDRGGREL